MVLPSTVERSLTNRGALGNSIGKNTPRRNAWRIRGTSTLLQKTKMPGFNTLKSSVHAQKLGPTVIKNTCNTVTRTSKDKYYSICSQQRNKTTPWKPEVKINVIRKVADDSDRTSWGRLGLLDRNQLHCLFKLWWTSQSQRATLLQHTIYGYRRHAAKWNDVLFSTAVLSEWMNVSVVRARSSVFTCASYWRCASLNHLFLKSVCTFSQKMMSLYVISRAITK